MSSSCADSFIEYQDVDGCVPSATSDMDKALVYELRQQRLDQIVGDATFSEAFDRAIVKATKKNLAAGRKPDDSLTHIQSGALPDRRYEIYLGVDCGQLAGCKLGVDEDNEVVFLTEDELNDVDTTVELSQWDCSSGGEDWLRFRNVGTGNYLGVSNGRVNGMRFVLTAKHENIRKGKSTIFSVSPAGRGASMLQIPGWRSISRRSPRLQAKLVENCTSDGDFKQGHRLAFKSGLAGQWSSLKFKEVR